jgi:polysaccharide biosynthesis protein PslG
MLLRCATLWRLALVLAVLAIPVGALSLAPASATAAPRGFYGVVYAPGGLAMPYATVAKDFNLMKRAGIQSARIDFPWFQIEPAAGVYRFDLIDPIVAQAAASRIQVLPVVNATPMWASPQPDRDFTHWAPTDLNLFANYARALIRRYGPQGTFWAENPALRRQPIRTWQLWNEPSASYFWATPNYPQSYPALVRVAYDAIKQADPGAKVVLAGLASFRKANGRVTTSWGDLAAFYRNGLRGHYDVLALHPFAANLPRLLKTIRLSRRVLKRNREARKPIWITELSWSAPPLSRLPRRQRVGIEVSPRRQRSLLTQAYKRFRADRKLRVARAYWYEWSTAYTVRQCTATPASFEFAGLVRTPCGSTSVKPTALYRTYRRVAR